MRGAMLVAAALVVAAAPLRAQSSATPGVTVSATVIKALSMTKVSAGDIDFGSVPIAVRSRLPTPSARAILYRASGQPSTALTVTYSDGTLSDGAGATLGYTPEVAGDVNPGNQSKAPPLASGSSVTLDAGSGNFYFWVGGSVTPPTGTPAGVYTATWTLTVAYTGI